MIYKEKRGTLSLLILLLEVLEKPCNKNKQVTPTPNMKCHQTEQSKYGRSAAGYTYPKGRLLPLALGCVKVSSFLTAKTSANKRFFTMTANPNWGLRCKGTKKIAYAQGICDFFGVK